MNQTRVEYREISRTERSSLSRATAIILAFVISLGFTIAHAQDTNLAFQGVQQALEDARQMVLREAPTEGTDQAEGFRYVLRRIEQWLANSGLDDSDPGHPHVSRCPTRVCKLGFDSPDFVYLSVGPIDDQHDYRVYGKRNRGRITEQERADFFAAGYERRHLIEIILGLSQKVVSNYVNHLADTPVDKPFEKFIWES